MLPIQDVRRESLRCRIVRVCRPVDANGAPVGAVRQVVNMIRWVNCKSGHASIKTHGWSVQKSNHSSWTSTRQLERTVLPINDLPENEVEKLIREWSTREDLVSFVSCIVLLENADGRKGNLWILLGSNQIWDSIAGGAKITLLNNAKSGLSIRKKLKTS